MLTQDDENSVRLIAKANPKSMTPLKYFVGRRLLKIVEIEPCVLRGSTWPALSHQQYNAEHWIVPSLQRVGVFRSNFSTFKLSDPSS